MQAEAAASTTTAAPATAASRHEDSLARVLEWAHSQSYAGFSKFDAFNTPLLDRLTPSNHTVRAYVTALWARLPIDLRPGLGTVRSRNPKGIALFATAYLRRYRRRGDPGDLRTASELLEWLDAHACRGYSGPCWGYDHDWYSVHFHAPKDTPNIVVTGNVVRAFLEAFEVSRNARYLELARGACEFILKDLPAPIRTPESRNIGYVPGCNAAVLNINGLASSVLIWVWQLTGEAHLRREAELLMRFLVDKQTANGAWHYAWPAETSRVRHDNYHTGNCLDWLLDFSVRSGDGRYLASYERGLQFYRDHLFVADGAPKWMSDQTYPFDIHGAAQAIVTFSKAATEFDATYLTDARRVADWAIGAMQSPAGFFYYQQGRFWKKRYTLMRWCNAWMAYALSSLLLAEDSVGGGAA